MSKKAVYAIFALIVVVLSVSAFALTKIQPAAIFPSATPIRDVPDTSASAITSPPLSMDGINTHTQIYGTDADPNRITLGPKVGNHPG